MSIRLAPRTDSMRKGPVDGGIIPARKKFLGEAPLSIRPEHLPPYFLYPYKRFIFEENSQTTHPILIAPLLFPPC